MKTKTILISAFPGSGKTTFESKIKHLKSVDLESSNFKWIIDQDSKLSSEERKGIQTKPNNQFPGNYIDEMIRLGKTNKYDIIFISSEIVTLPLEQTQKLKDCFDTIIAITPEDTEEMKNIFINRYKNRNNDPKFIELIKNKWSDFISDTQNSKIATNIIELTPEKKYISDFFKKKPYLISIEGLDKAGKHTAAKTIKEFINFTQPDLKVSIVSFPRYGTPVGDMIWDWLHDNDNSKHVSAKAFELMQGLDKRLFSDELNSQSPELADIYILDRYIHTQLAYGQYENDINWLKTLAEGINFPNETVYLDISPKTSMSRKGEHGENDKYESNLELLNQLQKNYKIAFAVEDSMSFPQTINAERDLQFVKSDIKELTQTSILPNYYKYINERIGE